LFGALRPVFFSFSFAEHPRIPPIESRAKALPRAASSAASEAQPVKPIARLASP
jgi:hypothetical protein